MRAIAIVRVSQRDKGALSPEVQVASMVGLAARHEWGLTPEDILDENVDADGKVRNVSGGWDLEDRPKLRYALEEIEAGRAQVVIAERLDRLFRDFDHQRAFINRVDRAGGKIATVNQGSVSHDTAEAEATANMHGVMAQYMKRTAAERSWDAVEIAIEQGKTSGAAPLGYVKDKHGVLKPDRKTVAIVQEAFELRGAGASAAEVRDFLTSKGIKRTVAGVRQMLTNKLYVGEVHFVGRPDAKRHHTPNLQAHEAIIDRDLFDRVGKMVVPAGRKAKSERLLARLGVLRCGSCDGKMSVSKTGTGYWFYRCANQECTQQVTIAADPIEKVIVETVVEHRRSEREQARGEQVARVAEEAAVKAQERLTAAIRTLEDFGDEEATHERLAALRGERDRLRAAADALAAAYPPVVTVDVERVFADGTLAEKRTAITNAVSRVSIAPGRSRDRVTIDFLI